MFENKKAHYNLLHFSHSEQLSETTWETRNYRALTDAELLSEVQEILPSISSLSKFEQLAKSFESPEDMAEALCPKELQNQDLFFLLVFELWRRQLHEKRTVSVFCDELDHQIASYYTTAEEGEEILDIIEYLKQILDDNVDNGVAPTDILPTLQEFCCHDIEAFLYDYTLAQIEEEQYDLAAELIAGFHAYLLFPVWFDYLAARLEIKHAPKKGHQRLLTLINELQDVQLALEILDFLAQTADPLFKTLLHHTLPLLHTEADFSDLLQCCAMYTDDPLFEQIIEKRASKDPDSSLSRQDADLKKIKGFFSDES